MKSALAMSRNKGRGRSAATKKAVKAVKIPSEVTLIREASREHWRDEVILGRHAPERHHITTEGRLKTAYWTWKDDAHCIAIGEDIREQTVSADLTTTLPVYIGAFLRHELAHALFTERDLNAVSAACKKVGFTFRTLNLFEDARIEQAYRDQFQVPFNWLDHEPMPTSGAPAEALFALIQAEGEPQIEWMEEADPMKMRVIHYYQRCINARNTWDVIPVVADWIKEFPDQVDNPMSSSSFSFPTDMELALEFLLGEHKPVGVHVVVNGMPKPVEAAEERAVSGERVHVASNAVMKMERKFPLTAEQMGQAKQLADRLRREFKVKKGWESTANVTRRLNARRLSLDVDRIYRERTVDAVSKIKIAAVLDLSGSMSREPSVAMRIMVTALSMLTATGHVEGTVTLSANVMTETFKLPLSDGQIAELEGFGGSENLAATFKTIEPILVDADLVICITDGHITDGPVDVERLARRGIKCLGLYVGEDSGKVNLSKWFAQYLARTSVKELIDEIGARIRPHIKSNR